MNANELTWKFKSKEDFIQYLDKHRKYPFFFILIPAQSSTISQKPMSSIKTSSRTSSWARSC